MKYLILAITLAVLTASASGIEYVTLSKRSPSVGISAGSLVEIVGFSRPSTTSPTRKAANFTLANGDVIYFPFASVTTENVTGVASHHTILGNKFTNVARVDLIDPNERWDQTAVTLKIIPASELNVVSPGTVLVLPEDTTGNFDIVIQTSGDLVTWKPFYSQTVNSQTAQQFFRTRITKTPAPAAP